MQSLPRPSARALTRRAVDAFRLACWQHIAGYHAVRLAGRDIESGHYVAYVRHRNGVWLKCNDSVVRSVGLDAVLSSQAYMLLYQRVA